MKNSPGVWGSKSTFRAPQADGLCRKGGAAQSLTNQFMQSLVLTKTKTDGKIVTGCAINLPKDNGKLLIYI